MTFQCNPGLVPSQQMMSVCAANGSWTPDPAELVCRGKPGGIVLHQVLCISSLTENGYTLCVSGWCVCVCVCVLVTYKNLGDA